MTTVEDVEYVVLLDEAGRAAGRADKARVHHAATPLHLAFSCYVFDGDDRLVLTRRARTKRTFPGVWTNSFCGHPAPGEPLARAVRRRAEQELGLVLDDLRLVLPGFAYRAEQDGVVENELCPVFVARAQGEPAPDPGEVEEVRRVPWSQFADAVRDDRWPGVSPWTREQVPALVGLGPAPSAWAHADPTALPPAARGDAV